ncbi:hypothetical protein GSB9_00721 [Flavobacteriaceae bacterium GSB9]|nr:hypothetical protein GSB9_00721 [Flavobacteriaceae bacterium GSB9]
MGYMGFGMQKWIYSRNPRKKLFEKDRIPSFNALPKYSRTFAIQASKRENKRPVGILTILIIVAAAFIVFCALNSYSLYEKKHAQQIMQYHNYQNDKTFRFLMTSGKERLRDKRPLAAYSEFKLAQKIYPNHTELQQVLTETLTVLCDKESKYCKELDEALKSN